MMNQLFCPLSLNILYGSITEVLEPCPVNKLTTIYIRVIIWWVNKAANCIKLRQGLKGLDPPPPPQTLNALHSLNQADI